MRLFPLEKRCGSFCPGTAYLPARLARLATRRRCLLRDLARQLSASSAGADLLCIGLRIGHGQADRHGDVCRRGNPLPSLYGARRDCGGHSVLALYRKYVWLIHPHVLPGHLQCHHGYPLAGGRRDHRRMALGRHQIAHRIDPDVGDDGSVRTDRMAVGSPGHSHRVARRFVVRRAGAHYHGHFT